MSDSLQKVQVWSPSKEPLTRRDKEMNSQRGENSSSLAIISLVLPNHSFEPLAVSAATPAAAAAAADGRIRTRSDFILLLLL